MTIQPLTLAEAEFVAYELAQDLMQYDEPMPDFSTRYPGTLESCLAHPFQQVGGRYVYFRLTKRAAVLFYLVIKNHPFINGNKRMAVTLTLTFLYKNHKWLNVSPHVLYNIACQVAESEVANKDAVIELLNRFIRDNTVEE